jgi:uncharacterized protein YicC (UPF0701 family)
MLESMTGFSEASDRSDRFLIQVSIKSVNGKFLNISTKCNRQCLKIEEDAYRILKSEFRRGTITVMITLKADPLSSINFESLSGKLGEIPEEFQPVTAELGSLIRAVSGGTEQEEISKADITRASSLLETCARKLRESRQAEGAELEKEILMLLDRIETVSGNIREQAPEIEENLKQKLTASVNELIGPDSRIEEADIAREIALRCEKADIREETERIAIHIQAFRNTVAETGEAAGKKLNFLCQELHREVNTLGVKIMETSFASPVIDLKTDIEKLKEQIQNVE